MSVDEIVETCGLQHLCKESECIQKDYKLCTIYNKLIEAIYRDSIEEDKEQDKQEVIKDV